METLRNFVRCESTTVSQRPLLDPDDIHTLRKVFSQNLAEIKTNLIKNNKVSRITLVTRFMQKYHS